MKIINRDCAEAISEIEHESVAAVVTDPPYGISFMGRKWDRADTIAHTSEFWRLIIKVLKPGGIVTAFGGPRTIHRLSVALEDAGFEIRDMVAWLYGSGFPKGKILKPAFEPIVLARKPSKTSTALNLNIADAGVPRPNGDFDREIIRNKGGAFIPRGAGDLKHTWSGRQVSDIHMRDRHPSNVAHDDSESVLAEFPDAPRSGQNLSSARFFYCAKPSQSEKEAGLSGMKQKGFKSNYHPTVKPVKLMRWLIRLTSRPGDVILDPFCGSGTTGIACCLEGREFIGIEREEDFAQIAEARIAAEMKTLKQVSMC